MDCGRLMCTAPQFLHGETFQVAIATQKTFLHLTDAQNVDSHQGFVNLWKWAQRVYKALPPPTENVVIGLKIQDMHEKILHY